jgi:hypothetical protein
MAQCQLGYHGTCDSCKEPVNRTADHVHHWSKRNGGVKSVLCRECCAITFVAAATLLRTVEEYNRISGSRETVETLIDQERLTIAIQERLI